MFTKLLILLLLAMSMTREIAETDVKVGSLLSSYYSLQPQRSPKLLMALRLDKDVEAIGAVSAL
jgi:hypothetical protein